MQDIEATLEAQRIELEKAAKEREEKEKAEEGRLAGIEKAREEEKKRANEEIR